MKKRNIAAITAVGVIVLWEMGVRPHVIKSQLISSLEKLEITQCQSAITTIDWAALKQKPPQSIDGVTAILGEGCRGELGTIAYEFGQFILSVSPREDGSVDMKWSEEDGSDI